MVALNAAVSALVEAGQDAVHSPHRTKVLPLGEQRRHDLARRLVDETRGVQRVDDRRPLFFAEAPRRQRHGFWFG